MRKGESSTEERSVRERHVLSRFCINRRTKRRSFRKLSVKSPVSNFQLACMTLVKRRCGGNGDFTTASGTPIKDRDYRDFPLKLSRFTPPASLSLSWLWLFLPFGSNVVASIHGNTELDDCAILYYQILPLGSSIV